MELLRLGIVLLLTAAGFALGGVSEDPFGGRGAAPDAETMRLITSVLGALVGYVVGGVLGRGILRQVDTAVERLEAVPAAQLVAAALGVTLGGLTGVAVLLPVLLLPATAAVVPIGVLVVLVLAYAGGRLGASRGADLGRFIGMRGRLEVSTPSRGGGVKLVDTSALVDGRLVDVARSGFLEGLLVLPTSVLDEVRHLADSGDETRRQRGRRALDLLRILQDEGLVGVEVTEDRVPQATDVDAELVALARARRAALVTCDSGLARVAEVSGVRVLNLHALADAVRPPVLPGDHLVVRPVKLGTEPGQGVAYLEDGTMVVVDGAADRVGEQVPIGVTSLVSGRRGRMVFGAVREADA